MSGREISSQNRDWLQAEARIWAQNGLVSEDQVSGILSLYETSGAMAERKKSNALNALMGVAAFMVGLAVLLLIGYNWAGMPRGVKLVIIFATIAGTYATGFTLRYKHGSRILSEVTFFLGCLFYGAGIWLIAQIFHLNAHYPDGFWWWAVGVIPIALCLDTLLTHALLVALLAIWCGTEIIGFPGLGGWFFGRWHWLANGAYSLPLLALLGLTWAYRKKSLWTIGLYVPLLTWWLMLQPIAWHWGENSLFFIGSIGGLLLIVAESHRAGSPFAIPYRIYGTLASASILIGFSFYKINGELVDSNFAASGIIQTIAITCVSLITVYAVALVRRRNLTTADSTAVNVLQLVRRQWLPLSLVALMVFFSIWLPIVGDPLLPTILANVAMISFAIWLMRIGLQEDRGRPFAAGVIYFLLWTVLRYIDLFGDFGGMLGASLMFFLCGASLFGVAIYWRRRKEVQHA